MLRFVNFFCLLLFLCKNEKPFFLQLLMTDMKDAPIAGKITLI